MKKYLLILFTFILCSFSYGQINLVNDLNKGVYSSNPEIFDFDSTSISLGLSMGNPNMKKTYIKYNFISQMPDVFLTDFIPTSTTIDDIIQFQDYLYMLRAGGIDRYLVDGGLRAVPEYLSLINISNHGGVKYIYSNDTIALFPTGYPTYSLFYTNGDYVKEVSGMPDDPYTQNYMKTFLIGDTLIVNSKQNIYFIDLDQMAIIDTISHDYELNVLGIINDQLVVEKQIYENTGITYDLYTYSSPYNDFDNIIEIDLNSQGNAIVAHDAVYYCKDSILYKYHSNTRDSITKIEVADFLSSNSSQILFTGLMDSTGTEYYVSDGTSQGTFILKDIWPGEGSSNSSFAAAVNETFYFVADDSIHGQELWLSDGTGMGTKSLLNIHPADSFVQFYEVFGTGNYLIFRANKPYKGTELFFLDEPNNHAITSLDFVTNDLSSYPRAFRADTGSFYFKGSKNGVDNYFQSDGSSLGTILVEDSIEGEDYPPIAIGDSLYFFTQDVSTSYSWDSLWRTNMNNGIIEYINIDPSIEVYLGMMKFKNQLFVAAKTSNSGLALFKLDHNTQVVDSIGVIFGSYETIFDNILETNEGNLIFNTGSVVWLFEPSGNKMKMLMDSVSVELGFEYMGVNYFLLDKYLYRFNASNKSLEPYSESELSFPEQGKEFIMGNYLVSIEKQKIWVYDMKDSANGEAQLLFSNEDNIVYGNLKYRVINDSLLLSASSLDFGEKMHKTFFIYDIQNQVYMDLRNYLDEQNITDFGVVRVFDGKVYFTAKSDNYFKLFKLTGNSLIPEPVDLNVHVDDFVFFQDELFISADDGSHGFELMKYSELQSDLPYTFDIPKAFKQDETCKNSNDGMIWFEQASDYEFNFEASGYTSESVFDSLYGSSGSIGWEYSIVAKKNSFFELVYDISIFEPQEFLDVIWQTHPISCYGKKDAAISYTLPDYADDGTPNGYGWGGLEIRLENQSYVADTIFKDLSAGEYMVYVKDSMNCTDSAFIQIDSSLATSDKFYRDEDGDGYVILEEYLTLCQDSTVTGWTNDWSGEDCDDTDPEVLDGFYWYADMDSDGFIDTANYVYQCEAPENYRSYTDSIDCDDFSSNITQITWYADSDNDGFVDTTESIIQCDRPSGYASFNGENVDCNDNDNSINQESTWYADNDGDGFINSNDFVTACTAPDGYVAYSVHLDCDDNDPEVQVPSWYADFDGDGYVDTTLVMQQCEQPANYLAYSDNFDCNDQNAELTDNCTSTSIAESKQTFLSIYPNPTKGKIYLVFNSMKADMTVAIFNMLGQKLQYKKITNATDTELTIRGEAGIYFIEIANGNERAVYKIIKE